MSRQPRPEFFYIPLHVYDRLAAKSLPYYHEAHKVLIESISGNRRLPLRFLDLGAGTGTTTEYVLREFPRSRGVAVDLHSDMLEEATARLKKYSNRVELVRADNARYLRDNAAKFDLVVSAFCIHHQTANGKRRLFRLIREHLRKGGQFVMLDLTTFGDPHLAETARRHTIAHMLAHVKDMRFQREWIYHWNHINIPHPADTMVRWLDDAGFKAETVFRWYEVAVIRAVAV